MFKKILERLATYTEPETMLSSDIADTLHEIVNTECKARLGHNHQLGDLLFVSAYSKWAERCAFELGIIDTLTGENEGSVAVDWRLAKQILETIKEREVQHHKRCKICKDLLDNNKIKMRNLEPTDKINLPDGKTADIFDIWAFCPSCAKTAGPEWKKA